jgi:hypothetical protein
MANYKTHKNIGIVSTIGITSSILILNYISSNILFSWGNFNIDNSIGINKYTIILMIFFGILGSIFPDIDLKTSTPAKYMRNFLMIFLTLFFFLFSESLGLIDFFREFFNYTTLVNYKYFYNILNLIISLTFPTIIIFILQKTMKHRGILHSIPFGLFSSIIIFELFQNINNQYGLLLNSFYISFLFFTGFLTHLILDEIYSVDLVNKRIKKSFGSALKILDKKNLFGSFILIGLISFYFKSTIIQLLN